MSPEQTQRRRLILRADDRYQYAVVELLSRSYLEEFPDDVSIAVRRGRTLTMLCRYAEAEAAFDAAFSHASDELLPFIWNAKAESASRRGDLVEAEKCYLLADELLPRTSWILIPLAHVTWLRGDLKLAQRRFQQALLVESSDGDRDEALFNLGGVLVALGRLDEAAACYREAVELSPDYEIAQNRLEDVQAALLIQQREP
jgi:tetratricopeptide (TPR) repeat protein